jgi:capsular polysaccharide export protein
MPRRPRQPVETIARRRDPAAPVTSERDRPAIVAATYWWNRPTLRALLSTPAGPPVFVWRIDDAITRASRIGADIYVWASRLEERHVEQAGTAGLTLWRIEDGFLRSIGLGAGFVTAASLAIDRRGIYYDASCPSDLEHALETADLSPDEIAAGAVIRQRILEARLSKYNLAADATPDDEARAIRRAAGGRPIVLVPGQVGDDASILKTVSETIDLATSNNVNVALLASARARNPDAFLVFKPHPDVIAGLRHGAVPAPETAELADHVTTSPNIVALIDSADRIETISSLAGFEGLLRGKAVACHGVPFYAGWGLTEDLAAIPPRRTRRRTLDELVAIAFTRYTRHVHPYWRRECTCLELIDGLVRQRGDARHHARNALLGRAAWACERLGL